MATNGSTYEDVELRRAFPLSAPQAGLAILAADGTDLAWIDVAEGGFLLREIAPGVTADDVRAAMGAPLRVASDCREMQFG